MPPTIPINHYFGPRNQQNRTKVLFHYSMLMYSSWKACFEHSNFFKVKILSRKHHSIKNSTAPQEDDGAASSAHLAADHSTRVRSPTTSFLTATTLIYAIGAGITAAAGTRLALQLVLDKVFTLFSFQLQDPMGPVLLFIVTTSLCQDWVICAPAAFLGSGGHFSGPLSGIEP